ncbi:hypothetical protein [Geomicrobium sp. JCM 19055]|uniref:hypothetical protein n=1 Tax=Geomicrobium sp. JCM 19055 TaxID=1460649 RepID=UPI00045ED559|nr:hypothetical protein [Geomicrobium sp. JCM 19055]GAJ99240.1 hypothetical protein JCM19055_2232 [Geomicrobium sp. JCM 19055]
METRDRIVFLVVYILAAITITLYYVPLASISLILISAHLITLSLVIYVLWFKKVSNFWFYNSWAANGLVIILTLIIVDEYYLIILVLFIIWLTTFGIDILFRKPLYERNND